MLENKSFVVTNIVVGWPEDRGGEHEGLQHPCSGAVSQGAHDDVTAQYQAPGALGTALHKHVNCQQTESRDFISTDTFYFGHKVTN